MTSASPSVSALASLFTEGSARVPESWSLTGPAESGLWWRAAGFEVVATPRLLRLAAQLPTEGEQVALLLSTEARFRQPWLDIIGARLAELGAQERLSDLCRQISDLGVAARALVSVAGPATAGSSPHPELELGLFKAPADQPAATPGLVRVLGLTAPLVEGGQGTPMDALEPVHSRRPSRNWVAGRLLQAPSSHESAGAEGVLAGAVRSIPAGTRPSERMARVLETPWLTLLAVLAFTMEAWAAERQGGLQLELPERLVEHFARPPRVDVVVTLADGHEVLCGSLGELCLRAMDALGMAVVPVIDAAELDRRLGPVVAELLRAGVWRFRTEGRTRYEIGEGFGFDCYRGEGHEHIYLGAEQLSQTLRGVAVTWAKALVEQAEREARV